MKNILVVTPIYPGPNVPEGFTPVVHYFVHEWVKLGCNVRVFSLPSAFPNVYYSLSKRFVKIIESISGHLINTTPISVEEYVWDDVSVNQYPVHKYIPYGRFSKKTIAHSVQYILHTLRNTGFIPDVIVGHWENPTIEVILKLKAAFRVPCSVVFHGDGSNFGRLYSAEAKEMLSSIDLIGFRNEAIQRNFERRFGIYKDTFICYSGIPKALIDETLKREFDSVNSFIFVGNLIQRKHPFENLKAVLASNVSDFTYKIIGTGSESNKINRMIKHKPSLKDKVILMGRMPREKVAEELSKSDVFIMISENEIFGLVYLEAMAKGCITIASKGEAFDSIIVDGKNGFLCEPGNLAELSSIIDKIASLPKGELIKISNEAISTAKNMTDEKVAREYLDHLGLMYNAYQEVSNRKS